MILKHQDKPLLSVRNLTVGFHVGGVTLDAVRGIDLDVSSGEVVGIVGESGSGKSVAMLACLGLVPRTARVAGSVRFQDKELVGMRQSEMRKLRGSRIAMIFQDPLSSLNPVLTIGSQIVEAIRLHQPGVSRKQAYDRAVELLDLVAIPQPDRRVNQYPHEFSGGMRQRAMIAMAVANGPDLLIADEPTTALDVTVQAQVLDVLKGLRDRLDLGIVLITHDLGVVAGNVDRVAVIYSGRVVEAAEVGALFRDPRHPYTRGLLSSIPKLDEKRERLFSIEGTPPPLGRRPPGCAYHPRCTYARGVCLTDDPALRVAGESLSACHFADRLEEIPVHQALAAVEIAEVRQ
ncbi:ABC transporter ATP-binding protein [Microvirga sp. 0TCS3.31]